MILRKGSVMMEKTETIIIGIDHGFSHIKTASEIFITGVDKISTEPAFYQNIVEYNGKYYQVGGKRIEVSDSKVENENFYILTLAAIAKEFNIRRLHDAHIHIAAGLPLTRYGEEKPEFVKYLSKNKEVQFKFEGKPYHAYIDKVSVYPQCYAAVVDRIAGFKKQTIVVGLGSWTVDILSIIDQIPDERSSRTIDEGLIKCMREINDECMRIKGKRLSEFDIEDIMVSDKSDISEEYKAIVRNGIKKYCSKILHILKEYGVNLETDNVVFAEGGASVMKKFGGISGKNIRYVEDIRANAKGYEFLARLSRR